MWHFSFVLISVFLWFPIDSFRVKPRSLARSNPALSDDFPYRYEEVYFTEPVDHFGFTNNDTFQLRYLINDTYWNQNESIPGPIFFYTGNEGEVEDFANNTGFMWDIAPEYNALLIFAEHRYYGKSLPYGNLSFTDPTCYGYLTTEQALADYAALLTSFKANVSEARNSPIITFGGSYGGMLSAWLRMKYPHVVAGAIASSAPIFNFEGTEPPVSCESFDQVVTKDFNNTSVECAETIRNSWSVIDSISETANGKNWISKNWKLCDKLGSSDDISTLKNWLSSIWFYLAMVDYPYAANFLAPLPGYPIKAACQFMPNSNVDNKTLLMNVFGAVNMYFNYTGNTPCMDINNAGSPGLGMDGWNVQTCNELVMPSCSDGIHDFFQPSPWNLTNYLNNCISQYGMVPRPLLEVITYGGRNLQAATNIVFSNGLLDPWHPGGVLKSVSSTVVAIIIPEGAHHLDLRASNPGDPISVIQARNMERMYIDKWITEERAYYYSTLD